MLQSQIGKLPPHDIAAEEAVIGSLLIDGSQIINVGKLQPGDFYSEQLGIIFQSCQSLYYRQTVIDKITVAEELERIGKLETCGGVAYLFHIESLVGSPLDIPDYVKIVSRLSVARQAIVLGEKVANVGFDNEADQKITLDKVTQLVQDFKKNSIKFESVLTPRDSAEQLMRMIGQSKDKTARINYGFVDIDRVSSGLEPSELVIIGGRPSAGKTQLMLDIAENIEKQGKKILLVSAEMSMRHLLERKVARLIKKSIKEIRSCSFTDSEEDIIMNAAGRMSELNTYTLPANLSSHEIYTEALRLKEQVGLDIVFVDYLQKLQDCYGERENQNIRVSRAIKTLRDIAFDLDISVVVLSQLSRMVEARPEDERLPVLSDLRDSGSIEQDADVVWLLYRYKGNAPTTDFGEHDPRLLRVKLAKNRQMDTAPAQTLLWFENEHKYVSYQEVKNGDS